MHGHTNATALTLTSPVMGFLSYFSGRPLIKVCLSNAEGWEGHDFPTIKKTVIPTARDSGRSLFTMQELTCEGLDA